MAEVKMSGLTKFISMAFALWVATFVVISGFGSNAVFQVIRGLWPLLTLPVALIFILLLSIAIFMEKRKYLPLFFLLLAAIALATFKKTSGWSAWINFRLHKSGYESVVAKVLIASSEEEREKICNGACAVYHEDVV